MTSASSNANDQPQSIEALRCVIEARDAEVVLLKLMIAKLKLQLLRSNRTQFGSTSERFGDPSQCVQGTLIEAAPLDEVRPSATAKNNADAAPANTPAIDRSLPAHLPREQRVHRPQASAAHHDTAGQACGCKTCGGRLRQIGVDISEQLEYVPANFKVIRHVRPKLACVKCQGIFQADAPSRPIVRGTAGPGLLAHVMAAKYCDHLSTPDHISPFPPE